MPSVWSAMKEQLGQPCSQPGAEHEVLHQQLAAAVEQVGERAPALGRVEDVVLVDAHPRQRAALAGDLVAQARQFLLARQQRLALGNPFVPGYDAMVFGAHLGIGGRAGYCVFSSLWLLPSAIHSLFDSCRSREHLAAGIGTVGVTSVTGLRWTR